MDLIQQAVEVLECQKRDNWGTKEHPLKLETLDLCCQAIRGQQLDEIQNSEERPREQSILSSPLEGAYRDIASGLGQETPLQGSLVHPQGNWLVASPLQNIELLERKESPQHGQEVQPPQWGHLDQRCQTWGKQVSGWVGPPKFREKAEKRRENWVYTVEGEINSEEKR